MVVIFFSFVLGFLGGLVGGLVFAKLAPKRFPSIFAPQVIQKRGPSVYVVANSKKKPKSKSERELWEIENGILPAD